MSTTASLIPRTLADATLLPVKRLTARLPQPWRSILDWTTAVALAVVLVLAIKVEVANPYRIPSASMEPTLHCARPAPGCHSRFSDRVIANRFIYRFRKPRRGDIVVFRTPPRTREACQQDGVFVKRLIGLPGEVVSERAGVAYVAGRRLNEPYVKPGERDARTARWRVPAGQYFMMGDN